MKPTPTFYSCSDCQALVPITELKEDPLRDGSLDEFPRLSLVAAPHACTRSEPGFAGPVYHSMSGCVVGDTIHAFHATASHYAGTFVKKEPFVFAAEGDTCIRCGAIAGVEEFTFSGEKYKRDYWMRPKP